MRDPAMPREWKAAAAVVALCLGADPAQAQMWAGVGPRGVAMPDAPAAASPVGTPSAQKPSVARTAPPADAPLRHFATPLDGWLVTGESGLLRWPVYLTSAEAGGALRLRIGYMSAISVLPETSSLRLRVNGRLVGQDAIDAPQSLRRIVFTVPADTLKPGYNEVAVEIEQQHRVDCSVPATYELWTRIDPESTGLEAPIDAAAIAALADLPAVPQRPDGAMPIHVVLAGRTNPAHVERLVRATQALALRTGAQQPIVDFVQNASERYGLDLVLGTRPALAKLDRVAGKIGDKGPLVALLSAREGERPLVVVTGTDDHEVDLALASLAMRPESIGTEAGLRAASLQPARRMDGGETVALRDLGVDTKLFDGRFFKRSVAFSLPADVLAADYGRGTLDVTAGYAAGLSRDSQIRIDVNGRNSGIIKMPRAAGADIDHDQLFLPLGMMRPGVNRVDIYADTPSAADGACAAKKAPRFLLRDSSTLRLPTLARVQRLPDLAVTTAGALPYTQGRAMLVVPKPDRATMAAALSLTARVGVAADRVVPFGFATQMPGETDGSTLVVAPAQALDRGLMTRVGLNPTAVEAAWHDVAASKAPEPEPGTVGARWWLQSPDGPGACKLPPRIPATAGDPIVDPVMLPAVPAGWRDGLFGWLAAARGKVGARFDIVRSDDGTVAIGPATSLILAQGVSDARGDVTTIVTAPDAATLKAGVGCLLDPSVWTRVHGRLAALDASSGTVVATDATRFTYRGAADAPFGNGRLVAAGWFSLNPAAFVAACLLLALMLSGSTLWFVRGVGRRSE